MRAEVERVNRGLNLYRTYTQSNFHPPSAAAGSQVYPMAFRRFTTLKIGGRRKGKRLELKAGALEVPVVFLARDRAHELGELGAALVEYQAQHVGVDGAGQDLRGGE